MSSKVIQVNFQGTDWGKLSREDPKEEERCPEIEKASEAVDRELAEDHAADPIKSLEDIQRISEYLVGGQRYRDNMLFITGINLGLRISDLLQLRFCDIIDDDLSFKKTFAILEQKTKNTRTVKRNRYLTINEAVMDSVELYLKNTPGCKLSDYMFRGESNRCGNKSKPITSYSVERILKQIGRDLNIQAHMSTHTLRKTFGYHQMMMSGNSPRKLLLLQKMFGHSSSMQTLTYIGITGEEIEEAYMHLNLGGNHYMAESEIAEKEITAM